MTKSASALLTTHIAQPGTTLALCVKAKRTDGKIFGFTEHDQSLSINLSDGDGATTYSASRGIDRTALKTSIGLQVDDMDITGFFDPLAITKADLRAGRWDFADIRIFYVNWERVSDGVIKLRRGKLGRLRNSDDIFQAEIRSLFELYNEELVRLYHPGCPVDLGSSETQTGGGCGVRLDPPVWTATTAFTVRTIRDAASGSVVKPTAFNDRHFKCVTAGTSAASEPAWNLTIGGQTTDGTVVWEALQALTIEVNVSSVDSQRQFAIDYNGDASSILLKRGLCTFQDGLNNGLKFEISSWNTSTKKIALFLPAPFTINDAGSPSDTVKIQAGCQKRLGDCRDTFDNIENFQGFSHIPGNDEAFRTPDASI